MNITLNEINSFKRELSISVPWNDLENNYNKFFRKNMYFISSTCGIRDHDLKVI